MPFAGCFVMAKAPPKPHTAKPATPALVANTAETAKVASPKPRMRISAELLARMRRPRTASSQPQENPFKLPKLMPGIVPDDTEQLAMDNDIEGGYNAAWAGVQQHGMWAEGIGFMGYPYLAMLSQRSEYRQPVEVLAEEMTRKWIDIKGEGDDKSEQAQALNDAQERFKLRDRFRSALELDGIFGISSTSME